MALYFGSNIAYATVAIMGGDTTVGYFTALEFLKLKDHGVVKEISVGYIDEHSPLVKDLKEHSGAHTVRFDLDDENTMIQAFDGMQCAVICPPVTSRHIDKAKQLVQVAKKSTQLRHVLLVSVLHSEKLRDWDRLWPIHEMQAEFEEAANHWDTACVLCPSLMMNCLHYLRHVIREKRELMWLTEHERVAPVDYRDVAAAISRIATKHMAEGSDQRFSKYCITGSQLLSGKQMAKECSKVLNTRIEFKKVDARAMRDHFEQYHEFNSEAIHAMVQALEVVAKGYWNKKYPDLERLLGEPPTTLEEYLHRNRHEFETPHRCKDQ
ncbi:hypothetical protein EV182_000863 [Spiromyces aspiralis]|uniref:Uncharacterized protein n=1 Tax=Spiromyces aspiralis TaxID=68401 RepID=A0ACC1HTX6_9FUNG|nr:hypothetical protein EV182_000863 [Spiromyces aspiralis]